MVAPKTTTAMMAPMISLIRFSPDQDSDAIDFSHCIESNCNTKTKSKEEPEAERGSLLSSVPVRRSIYFERHVFEQIRVDKFRAASCCSEADEALRPTVALHREKDGSWVKVWRYVLLREVPRLSLRVSSDTEFH